MDSFVCQDRFTVICIIRNVLNMLRHCVTSILSYMLMLENLNIKDCEKANSNKMYNVLSLCRSR